MNSKGKVIWLTGLSGSGKTTLAQALQKKLPGSLILDGDSLREALGTAKTAFDSKSRKNLAYTYAKLANLLASQGATIIVATISLFHEVHAWNREHLPAYLEVFLDIPRNVREERDPKGLYAGEKKGFIKDMADVCDNVEFPLNPHITITENQSLDESVEMILNQL